MSVSIEAPQPELKRKPAYTIRILSEPHTKMVCKYDKNGVITHKEVKAEPGFLVTFAKGHSTWFETKEDLAKNGFGDIVPLINMETGDIEGTTRSVVSDAVSIE